MVFLCDLCRRFYFKSIDLQNYNLKKYYLVVRKLFLTVLVIVCSCTSKEVPEDLIRREKMTKILMEVHLLESKINQLTITPSDSIQSVYDHYEKLLFDDLEITQEQYERSFRYYVDNPAELEKVYNAVVDSLMQMEKTVK